MRHHFSNFEIFSNVLSGYDLEIRQIDQGSFSATLQQISCGSVSISRITSTRRMEANGKPPSDVITFGIPTENCLPFTWRNKFSSGNTIQIYKPNTELSMITHPVFEAIDISIKEEEFNRLNQQWEFEELNRIIGTREMVVCNSRIMRKLRNILGSVMEAVNKYPELLEQDIRLWDTINYEVPYLIALALSSAEELETKSAPVKQQHALKTAIDFIQATPQDKISLHQFCQNNDINARTLQRAFLERYGVSPKSYVKAYRLNNVYKTLTNSASDNTRISDIARSHGFRHMSQFALDYRRQFGELPSETLQTQTAISPDWITH